MFEIDRKPGGFVDPTEYGLPDDYIFDFTFENRYHIFHHRISRGYEYIAYDTQSNLSSAVCVTKTKQGPERFTRMIPDILYAIKSDSDKRFRGASAYPPNQLIDLIFRVIMPEYGYAVRESQITMAKTIYKGLTMRQVTLCEAEVGSGKTMAYLVASLIAKINDQLYKHWGYPVTITTSSIELQKMIIEKEIPALSQMLMDFGIIQQPLKAVLRKGKEHYFCPRRYDDYLTTIKHYPYKFSQTIDGLRKYDLDRNGFDLDSLNLNAHIKSNICVQGSCKNCHYPGRCRYAEFIEEAGMCYHFDFQVTNHNLFLMHRKNADTEQKSGIILNSNFVIIDEAHKLTETALDVYGVILDPREISKFLNSVKYARRADDKIRREYQQLLRETDHLNSKLLAALNMYRVNKSQDISAVKFDNNITITRLLERIKAKLELIENWNRPDGRGNTPSCARLLETLSAFNQTRGMRSWIKYDRLEDNFTLCSIPFSIGTELQRYLWSDMNMHFALTSGTMCDDTGFSFFKEEIGVARYLNEYAIEEYRCDSPFDYKNHSRLYISENVPDPDMDDPYYIPAVAAEIINLIRATRGRTAVLFTSYKLLSAVYEIVKPYLTDYPLIQMSRSNRNAIAQFKESGNGVLFASGSMWEGVDCAGDILSSVIIVRLPFPLRTHAMEQKKNRCASVHDFVQTYAVPQMIIKLRQGAGRLIRTESDTGVLAILDARAAKGGSYRHRVLTALSKYPLVRTVFDVRAFIDEVKDESYKKGA